MRNLMAAVYFTLALFGCDGGGTTVVARSTVDGVDQVLAQTRIKTGVAKFECVRSRSRQCHYALFPPKCAAVDANLGCKAHPLERFTMAQGDVREVIGLPTGFSLCVSPDARFVKPICLRP